jgi:opacity protein-like surface antigen
VIRRVIIAALAGACLAPALSAQAAPDSARRTVQDALYDRPFVGGLDRTAVGGYLEANTNYGATDGIGDGFSMELRRFNIFLFSTLGPRIRFLSELEFEHGTQEIALETAQLDLRFDPAFVLRAGIILPPLGAFNVNHDSPRWNFIDRPIVSTEVLPATLSEVGFGVHGRLAPSGFGLTYDVYLTNGLGDGVILNASGRTRLADGKRDEQFGEDNNGSPAVSGRVAVHHERAGEYGLSFYTAVYNSFQVEGEAVEPKRRLRVLALDAQTEIGPVELRGEVAHVSVEIPEDLHELFGQEQIGWHLDATVPVWRPRLRAFPQGVVSADVRLEYADFNRGRFSSTGGEIGDDIAALVLGASYRPVSGTVVKFNYRMSRAHDLQHNPAARSAAFQLGFATYF